MNSFDQINKILNRQRPAVSTDMFRLAMQYAETLAAIDNSIVVVSDFASGVSRIVSGLFSQELGLKLNCQEDSIWETQILERMSDSERERKYLTEIRYFNFIKRLPLKQRSRYHLAARMKICNAEGLSVDVLHRMYYLFSEDADHIECALCIYAPYTLSVDFQAAAIDSVSGRVEMLTSDDDYRILSRRELQVIACVDSGMTTADIADRLNISPNTVSRHRQQIIAKLQVKNSVEACRIAKAMKLI